MSWRNIEPNAYAVLNLLSEAESIIVLDTETTGLAKNAKIIQFSAIRYKINADFSLEQIDFFDTYINPDEKLKAKITEITGISQDMIEKCPKEDIIAKDIVAYLSKASIYAAHNAPFDIDKINAMFERIGIEFCLPAPKVIDTLPCARDCFPDLDSYKLQDIVENPEILLYLRSSYPYIQVDEYQDTNYIQRDIVYSLAGENGNLAVVGDDDQSIYMFRGAKPEIMLNFKKDYPNCKVIHMSTNYRSLQEIIQKADNLVQHNSQRFSKQFLGSRQEKGKVIFRNYLNSISQLGGVIHKIRSLLDDGIKPEQIAILYRTNKESMPFAEYFMNEKIPFQCNERLKSKYHHWIFQDIQAYQKLSRGKKDIISFNRILNHPNRFFYGKAFRSVNPDLESLNQAIYMQSGKEYWKIQKGLKNAADLFRHLKVLSSLNPVEFMNYLYRAVGYDEYLKQYADLRKLDKKELTAIWNNLYDEAKLYGNWGEWGRHIMAYNRQLQQANKNKDGIMLSTMHRSKGLEWEYVFIINCINGTIPHTNATEFEDIEEERRLFYVAMTRAKDSLYLTAYKKDGEGDKETNVSPFIEECNI